MVSRYPGLVGELETPEAARRRKRIGRPERYCIHSYHDEPAKRAKDNDGPFCSACEIEGRVFELAGPERYKKRRKRRPRKGNFYVPALSRIRKEKRIPWSILAEAAGISRWTAIKYASGKNAASPEVAAKFAEALGLAVADLKGDKE
jgi:DNA-binding XRE family transcriptional regulator